jgi:hypothetical protein
VPLGDVRRNFKLKMNSWLLKVAPKQQPLSTETKQHRKRVERGHEASVGVLPEHDFDPEQSLRMCN